MKVYAVINQKGGVGKTTTVANLGAALAERGHSTCLIDLDPQGHLTLHYGIEPGLDEKTIYDVMTSQEDVASVTKMVAPNLWVVPSTIDLAAAEVELVGTVGREQILHDKLSADNIDYEFVMIDCPPSLGLLTLNALAAANEVLIPLQPHFLALQGLGKLLETTSLVQRRINPKLRVAGVIFCMYETATRLAGEVATDVRRFFESARGGETPWAQARIFSTRIRRNIKLAECPSHGETIFQYDSNSNGAQDYLALAEEFLDLVFGESEPSDQPDLLGRNPTPIETGSQAPGNMPTTSDSQATPPQSNELPVSSCAIQARDEAGPESSAGTSEIPASPSEQPQATDT